MSETVKNIFEKFPLLRWIINFIKSIRLPGLTGLSLYDLLEMYILGIIHGALTIRASAIAFSFFMAIFPFLLFILILIPYIPIDGFQNDFLRVLNTTLPPTTSDFFNKNIFDNINNQSTGGLLSSVFIVSMFLMANGVNAIFSGFQNSYHQQLNRNFINQYIHAIGVSLLLVVILVLTIAGLGFIEIYVVHPIYENLDFLDSSSELVWLNILKFLFFSLMIYIGISVLYFFGNSKLERSSFYSIGALLTMILVILNSFLFSVYIDNFSSYNQLYGSIGALVVLMFYLWLNAIILILGFELNTSLQKLKDLC
ncbi:MAG: YihY/virulence factor BrkB family protein [Flavobacteriaceae bacterium]